MSKRKIRNQIELRSIGTRSGDWRLEIVSLPRLRLALGEDLLVAFVRCFVHSDRLTTMAHFGALHSIANVPKPAGSRNYFTSTWMTIGILKEFATALRYLRGELAKKDLLALAPTLVARLRDVEERWLTALAAREIRNTQAFHVDSDVIKRGLFRLEQRRKPVTLFESVGGSDYHSFTTIAAETLIAGATTPVDQLDNIVRDAFDDTKIGLVIDDLFIAVLKHAGAVVKNRRWVPKTKPGSLD